MAPRRRSLVLLLALGIGWLLWASVNSIVWAVKSPASLGYGLRLNGTLLATGFALCLLLARFYRALQSRFSSWRLAGLAAAVCCLAAPCWRLAYRHLMFLLGWDNKLRLEWPAVAIGSMSDALVLGMFSLVCFTVDYWQELAEQREQTLRATALAHEAQLQMLRYQLNPHFLFNALNSIRSMIVEDPAKARRMVTALAEFLRHSLDGDEKRTTVGGELRAIENYLEIQRIRFEEKLQVTTRVEAGAESVAIPCFLIHPLVENAVKYGMQTSAMPLRIEIQVERTAGEVRIRVRNTGRLLSGAEQAGAATGTGLKNIAQRLKLVFPERHAFRLREHEGWVEAEISLTLDRRDTQHAGL